jgi:hypothetical protein
MKKMLAALGLAATLFVPAAWAIPVYVKIAPPAPVVETRVVAPGPGYVWVGGFHRWDGHAYVWVPGHWAQPPRPHAVWVAGHWVHHPHHGWYWKEGHWK